MVLKRTPIKRKSATKKRRPKMPCSWSNRCPRSPRFVLSDDERYCPVHVKWVAKKLVGDFVKARDGRCVLADFNDSPCLGDLQWAHLIPQGRYPCLRYEPDNAIAACLRHHTAFDNAPVEREWWMRDWLGDAKYTYLQAEAVRRNLERESVDLVDVIKRFRKLSAA